MGSNSEEALCCAVKDVCASHSARDNILLQPDTQGNMFRLLPDSQQRYRFIEQPKSFWVPTKTLHTAGQKAVNQKQGTWHWVHVQLAARMPHRCTCAIKCVLCEETCSQAVEGELGARVLEQHAPCRIAARRKWPEHCLGKFDGNLRHWSRRLVWHVLQQVAPHLVVLIRAGSIGAMHSCKPPARLYTCVGM